MPINNETSGQGVQNLLPSSKREIVIVKTQIPLVRAAAANFYIILIPMYVVFAAFFPFPIGLRVLTAILLIVISVRYYLRFISRVIVSNGEISFMNPITVIGIAMTSIETVDMDIMGLLGATRISIKVRNRRRRKSFVMYPDIGDLDRISADFRNILKENNIMVHMRGGQT